MTTFGEPYDFGSIMHYGPYSFAIDKSKPTIIPKHSPGAIMGQRLALSREDVDKIQKLYNCGQGKHAFFKINIKKKMWYDCQWDNSPQETKIIYLYFAGQIYKSF